MNRAYLILGGNLGNRVANIELTLQHLIDAELRIINKSGWYETQAWGMKNSPDFMNVCLEIESDIPANELLKICLETEKKMGRIRENKGYENRIIDIDILFFNEEIHNSNQLTLPHPRMHERKFVLAPLAEIAPQIIHPLLKKSVIELLQNCSDTSVVSKLENENSF